MPSNRFVGYQRVAELAVREWEGVVPYAALQGRIRVDAVHGCTLTGV